MSEQLQIVFWVLSVCYMGVGLFFAYRILSALGYIPVNVTFAGAGALLVLVGGAILASALQSVTFNLIQFISLLTTAGGKDALMASVWGNVPAWLYILLDVGTLILVFALAVYFGWGRVPELLAWSTMEEEPAEETEASLWEANEPSPAGADAVVEMEENEEGEILSFVEQGFLMFGLAYLVYSLLNNVLRLLLFVPFLHRPQQMRTNLVGVGAAWVAGLVLFAMVAYLVYNKVAEA